MAESSPEDAALAAKAPVPPPTEQKEPRWRTIERTIAALEKMLQPGAHVSHNVWLTEPVTGTRRQCDVIIRSGTPPRDTLTIVEVQDRNRRVELSDYEGWCQKREKLGAQHLICVSVTGFPESVQRDAAFKGGTVRLMTLLDPGVFPSFFAARELIFQLEVIEAYDMNLIFSAAVPDGLAADRIDEKKFFADNSDVPISASDIAESERGGARVIRMHTTPVGDGFDREYELDFSRPGKTFSLRANGSSYALAGLIVTEHCKRYHYQVKLEPLAYEQIGFGDSLGWVFWGVGQHQGEQLSAQIPVTRLPDGQIRVGNPQISTPKGHTPLGSEFTILYANPS